MMTFNPGHENSTCSIIVPSCLDAGQVVQWVVSLTHNVSVIGSSPIKGIQVRFQNQTKIN